MVKKCGLKICIVILVLLTMIFALSACGECQHLYGEWKNTKEPTCVAAGERLHICEKCGKAEIETVSASGVHNFTHYVSDGNATCTADGTKTAKCDHCDATDTITDEGSKLEHSFTKYVSDGNATCTADGTKTAKCDHCDATDTITDEGSKLEHHFVNNICDRCDEAEDKLLFKEIGDFTMNKTDYDYPALTLTVPNSKTTMPLGSILTVYEGCTWTVSRDIEGAQTIATKNISLSAGHNTFYVTVWFGDNNRVYIVDIDRLHLYMYQFVSAEPALTEFSNAEEGTQIAAPDEPFRAGYIFLGWVANDGQKYISFPYELKEDTVFYAIWSPISYSIAYELGGGTNNEANPATYTVEDEITLAIPVRTGYTFTGWREGNKIAKGSTENKTFTATWVPTAYSIVYQLNGGTNNSSNPKTYTIESNTITLADPTRTGYTFQGWCEGKMIAKGSTGNKTFTATWTPVTYTITYVLNGGMNVSTNPKTYTVESNSIALADPTRAGYNFTGWNEGNTIPQGSSGDKTFTATWMPIVYSVTYKLNGGTNNSSNPTKYTIESGTITLADPTRLGYTFTGWSEGRTIPQSSTGNKTFTAMWTPTVYSVTYELNGGMNNSSNPTSYTVEDTITLKKPTRTGYSFKGWFTDEALTQPVTDISLGSIGDRTFYAKWKTVTYQILYALNGGINDASNPSTYTVEDEIIFAAPTRTGYTFKGWFMDEELTKCAEGISFGSVERRTFYAKWEANVYHITYELNGGVNNLSNPATYTIANAVALSAPIRTGYTFKGWFADKELTQPATGISFGSIGDQSFYAKWEIVIYNITYNLNGGTSVFENPLTYTVEDTVTLSDLTRVGYTFAGWNEGSLIQKGSTGNKTFTASWMPISFDITYFLDGGTNNSANPTVYTIEDAITLAVPTRKGYTFRGWFADAGHRQPVTDIMLGSIGDRTFYAEWQLDSYSINYVLNGGTNSASNPHTYKITSSTITLAGAARKDYIFEGWYIDESLKIPITQIANGSTGDMTVYAKWEYGTERLTYALSSGTYVITGYTGTEATVVIPEKHLGVAVTSIGASAFKDCYTLTSVTIPHGVTSINTYAFSGCSHLESITIPDGVTSISTYAFSGCSSLTSITIPEGVMGIGTSTFESCRSLTSIKIPSSVTRIDKDAFYGCSSLQSVEFAENSKCTSIGKYAFQNCYSLTSITIPAGMTTIDEWAFSGCSSLTSIKIPSSVTSIGGAAFSSCVRLTIYCEAESKPSGWDSYWSDSYSPVVWNYKG